MQTCFFAISGVLPPRGSHRRDQEFDSQDLREKRRRDRGDESARGRSDARAFVRSESSGRRLTADRVPAATEQLKRAPEFVRNVLGEIIAGRGDRVPVSALPNDGTFPTGTTQWEKRNLASEMPVWDPEVCIQCGKCVLVCPHAVIRSKVYERGCSARCACDVQIARGAAAGVERAEIHAAGRGGRLHRLRDLRRCLPGAQQIRSAAESDQHAAAVAAARNRARELEFLPFDSGNGSPPDFD